MLKIIHRINTIEGLRDTPKDCGVEVDVRHDPQKGLLYLSHDPAEPGQVCDNLEEYLSHFNHAFIIFNIKEAGIEKQCIDLASKFGIPKSNYFLLDVEFPYFYRASRQEGVREIAVRFSEAEPIEMALAQKGFVDWVWIDTNTRLPFDGSLVKKLAGFKTCLVSPDRWGRPKDIPIYKEKMKQLNFFLDAVMVGKEHHMLWD